MTAPGSPPGPPPPLPPRPATGFSNPAPSAGATDAPPGSSLRTVILTGGAGVAPAQIAESTAQTALIVNRGPATITIGTTQGVQPGNGRELLAGESQLFTTSPLFAVVNLGSPLELGPSIGTFTATVEVAINAASSASLAPSVAPTQNLENFGPGQGWPAFFPGTGANIYYDVSRFTGIFVYLDVHDPNTTLSVIPIWVDALGNLINVTLPTTQNPPLNQMMQSSTTNNLPIACYYRCLGPLVRFVTAHTGAVVQGGAFYLYGTNMPGRFDGPYTPGMQGQVLAQSDSIAASGTIPITPYAGPAFLYGRGTGALLLQYQDTAGNWHEIGEVNVGNLTAPIPVNLPPAPCRILSTANAQIASVVAA